MLGFHTGTCSRNWSTTHHFFQAATVMALVTMLGAVSAASSISSASGYRLRAASLEGDKSYPASDRKTAVLKTPGPQ